MKIKLQSEIADEFELDLYEAYASVPVIMDNKMILGNYLAWVILLDDTFNHIPEELKKVLDERKTKSFYLKRSVLTITGLTAYQVRIGDPEGVRDPNKDEICAERVFDNFDENIGTFFLTSTCYFPYQSMGMYFQTIGEIFLEFDLADIFFLKYADTEDTKKFYKIKNEEVKEIKEINKEKPSSFLEEIHNRKFKKNFRIIETN